VNPGDTIDQISLIAQLGIGGVMLAISFVIWRQAQSWMTTQQEAADRRSEKEAERNERLIQIVMQSASEQTKTVREAAEYMHKSSIELRIATDRLTERRPS